MCNQEPMALVRAVGGGSARLTQPRDAGVRAAGTDLREGALGEDAADRLVSGLDAQGEQGGR